MTFYEQSKGRTTLVNSGTGFMSDYDRDINFAYLEMTGDFTAKVRIIRVQEASDSKAGIMVRKNLATNSQALITGLHPHGNLVATNIKDIVNGRIIGKTWTGYDVVPIWVKTVRRGDRIYSYRSKDGISWEKISEFNIDLDDKCYVGLYCISGDVDDTISAGFENFSVTKP